MRLTKTYEDGTYGVADDLPCGENSHDFKKLLIDKLGAFETIYAPATLETGTATSRLQKRVWDLEAKVAEQDKEIQRYKEALEWYADSEHKPGIAQAALGS